LLFLVREQAQINRLMTIKRKKRRGIDRRILILFSVMPFACLLAILCGLATTWVLLPSRFVNARVSDLTEEYADEVVVMAAADFAQYNDLARANQILARLEVPNTAQYVSLVAERLIRANRGPVSEDITNVVNLAKALGVSTVSMVAYVASPTPTAMPQTPTPTPTNTLVVQPAQAEAVAQVDAAAPPTDTPAPTDTPLPTDVPTNTPVPVTPTPVPPTDTPVPTPTNTPSVDFIVAKQRLLTKDENGGCAGNHNIFIDVIDANGNPLKGVQIGDIWNNPGPVTGHKGDDKPGRAEYDLYKDQGFYLVVKSDPSAGRPVTSEQTVELSADDWRIGIPRLIEAGYCPDEATCRVLWNSGVFGEGNNSICWGHYSWEVVFQRTW
jgi:hypothetical protein